MTWSSIELKRRGHVAVVTLNRPSRANTLTAEMLRELREAQIALDQDDDVRAVVVAGAGRHFCGGRDLHDAESTYGAGIGFDLLTKPIVAALHGAAVGGGCEVALACDFRIAHPQVRIGLPEIRFGELPAGGATARLPRLIGAPMAKRMIMLGDEVDAVQAERIGLVDQIAHSGDVLGEAIELAERIARHAPYAVRAAKLLVDRSLVTDLATSLVMEKQVTRTMASPAEREEARREAAAGSATYARIFAADRADS